MPEFGPGLTVDRSELDPADKRGVLSQWSGFAAKGNTAGLFKQIASNASSSSESSISDRAVRFGSNQVYVRRDVAYIPEEDIYHNSTRG